MFGGNADLKPETSDSYTLGLVLTPMRNLSLTFDYFNMTVDGVIGGAPPTTTLSQCIATGDPKFCSLITRDRLGTLWALPTAQIVATNQNLGMRKTSGIDVGANYGQKLSGYGALDFAFTGTYLKEFLQEDFPGSGVVRLRRLLRPKLRHPVANVAPQDPRNLVDPLGRRPGRDLAPPERSEAVDHQQRSSPGGSFGRG